MCLGYNGWWFIAVELQAQHRRFQAAAHGFSGTTPLVVRLHHTGCTQPLVGLWLRWDLKRVVQDCGACKAIGGQPYQSAGSQSGQMHVSQLGVS